MPEMLKSAIEWVTNTDNLVYIAEVALVLIGVFKCLIPLITTTRSMRRAIKRLQQDAGTRQGTPVWQEKRFMGSRLKGSWLRFLQNAEQLDRRGLPCNVEDYINDDTVTHGPGNAQLADLIPGLLTSLGILGTFMGMMDGLGGLDFSSSEAIIDGIPHLLTGMQFAFGTSVAGVTMSICFNVVNRILQGSSYRAIDDFVECFTSLAMSRPLDNDVQLICQNQDSNHMLSGLSEQLPVTLAAAMDGSVSRAMQPVAKAMDNFLIGATRAQVDGVGRIVTAFVQNMNASLNDQFLQLGRTMAEINQHQMLSMDHVRESMAAVGTIVNDVKQLHGVSQGVIDHFERYVQELSANRQRDERFEQTSTELLRSMQQMSSEQTAALQQVIASRDALQRAMTDFTLQSEQTLGAMQQSATANGKQLESVASTMNGAGQTLSESCQGFVQSVVSGLAQALGMFDQNMTTLVAALTEKVDVLSESGTSAETAAATAELQKLLTELKAAIPASKGV